MDIYNYKKKDINGRAAELSVYGTVNGTEPSFEAFSAPSPDIDMYVIFIYAHNALEQVEYVG